MSSLDFPLNPVDSQEYSLNGVTYYYNAALGAWLTKLSSAPLPTAFNRQVLFNDAGLSNGSYGLVFDKSANTLFANTINVSSNMRVFGNLQIGTGTVTITNNSISAASIIVGGSAIPSGAAANLAFDTANAAYAAANNVGPQIAPAFNTANAAYNAANNVGPQIAPAFNKANNALANTSGTFAGDLVVSGNFGVGQSPYSTSKLLVTANNTAVVGSHVFEAGAFGIRTNDIGGSNYWYFERSYGGWQSTPVMTFQASTGNIGIGNTTPSCSLDIGSKTDAIILPTGTTAQRPSSTIAGMVRFNSSIAAIDYYDGYTWNNITGGGVPDPHYNSTKILVKNGSLIDASVARRSITNNGATSTSSVGYPNITKFNSAVSLTGGAGNVWNINNGTSSYLTFGGALSDFSLSQSAWTVEFWMYATMAGNSYGHTFWFGGQGNNGVIKFHSADLRPYMYSNAGQSVGSSVSVASNTWTWVVFERYNGTIYSWINGSNRSSGTLMPTGGTPATAGLGIAFNAENYSHYVDEVRFTTVARYQGATTIPIQTSSWPER